MKFFAKVLVKILVEADTEEYAEELLLENGNQLHLDIQGCHVDHGCFSLKVVNQDVIELA